MDVRDLTRDQLDELKQSMLCQHRDDCDEGVSWGELANAGDLISDEDVFERYEGVNFSEDDFSSRELRYTTIDDLIAYEIEPALDDPADFDLRAIADAVSSYDGKGYAVTVSDDDFWQAVQAAQTPVSKLEAWLIEYPWRRETDAHEPLMLLEQIKKDLQ